MEKLQYLHQVFEKLGNPWADLYLKLNDCHSPGALCTQLACKDIGIACWLGAAVRCEHTDFL